LTRSINGSKKKTKIAVVAIGSFMAAILVLGAIATAQFTSQQSLNSSRFGGLGSAHEHAAFLVKIDGNIIDFSQSKYQVRSPYIHVENGDGLTLHKHAISVPFGEFLKSVGMDIQDNCFIMDDGKKYCDNDADGKKLVFLVNGQTEESAKDYVLQDGDRFLLEYGNITKAQLQSDLDFLNQIKIQPNE
jgi:hypothetical protein